MRKSLFFVLSLLVVFSMLLSACGNPTPEATPEPVVDETEEPVIDETEEPVIDETEEPVEEPEMVEITIWTMPNGADPQAYIDREIAAFMEEYPNINVTAEIVGWGDAYGRIQTAVQGGEGPCITQLGTTWVPTFGSMGGLRPYADEDIAALGGKENFVEASWNTGVVEGTMMAVPWVSDPRVIVYRADVLDQLGLTPEEAFADIDAYIETLVAIEDAGLTNADGVEISGIVHPGRNDWNVWQNATMWIWAYGGSILDGKEAVFNSPEAVEGVTTFNSLYGMGLTPEDTLELNSSQADSRFGEGSVATIMSGAWLISLARDPESSGWTEEAANNIAFVPFPEGPGGQHTFFGGSNLAIMNGCPHPEEAMQFVQFLLSPEPQIRYSSSVGLLPTTNDALADPTFTEDEDFSVFLTAMDFGRVPPNIPEWGQVENNLQSALSSLWEDVAAIGMGETIEEETVQQRLDEAAATVNSLIE